MHRKHQNWKKSFDRIFLFHKKFTLSSRHAFSKKKKWKKRRKDNGWIYKIEMEKDQGSKGYRGGKTSRSRILSFPRRRPRDKWGGKKRLRDHCNSSPLSLPVPSFFPPLNVSSPPYNFSRHSQINTAIHHHYHSSSRPAPLAKSSHTLPSTREREREREIIYRRRRG